MNKETFASYSDESWRDPVFVIVPQVLGLVASSTTFCS
jgi:hypothetical protein